MVVTLSDLDVADVSGMIAAAVALIQIVIPLALPVILVSVLKEDRTKATTVSAVSWSVIGQFLHSSRWPTLLFADSASIRGVPGHIVLITRLKTILAFLTAIAAVITPLGLYQTIVEDDEWTENVSFHYIQDQSDFGRGTPPRVNLPWSRICGFSEPVECPNSFSNITKSSNATGDFYEVHSYDSHVPQYVIDVFQSGLQNMQGSVSSIFDIQSRSYIWNTASESPNGTVPDNGRPYPVDSFRMISSNILADDYLAVEGLVVDMKNGGIGFRNHSAPPRTPYGSTWSEDLLFIEPESVCVDTNLTLDFSLPRFASEKPRFSEIAHLVLTDRGGFANLDLPYPNYSTTNTQRNPQLWDRAYKGAWMNNALSMLFFNVTNLGDAKGPDSRPSTYVGRQFPLMSENGSISPSYPSSTHFNQLRVTVTYGDYLSGVGLKDNISLNFTFLNTTHFAGGGSLYENPFNISWHDMFNARILCVGNAGQNDANLDNFVAECGMVYGAPIRTDSNSSSIVFEPGSHWSIPMYSCIMTVKATIKKVTFKFNGTDDLSALKITEIKDKVYPDEKSKPLWGVERSDKKLVDVNPLWGLISSPDQGNISLYVLQQESLYLPGYPLGPFSSLGGYDNLPGSEFYSKGVSTIFGLSSALTLNGLDIPDYSGEISLALLRRWQRLSRTAGSTGKILNLIWTDLASNAVVGTRGLHGAIAQGSSSLESRDIMSASASNTPAVKFMQRRVRYHWPYAIPAFIVLFLTTVIAIVSLVITLIGRAGTSRIRRFLNKTSQGRILITYLYGRKGETAAQVRPESRVRTRSSTRRWVENMGKTPVTVAEGYNDFLIINGPQAAQAQPLLQENPMT